MAESTANVSATTDTFSAWLTKTNEIATKISTVVVTANSTLGTTSGNAYLNGIFTANTLVAKDGLRGGNNTVNAALTITSNVSVTGAATFSNNVIVTGNTTLSNTLAVTGATTLSNTLVVTGTANLSSTLGVAGAATFSNSVAVTGNTTLSNTLAVTGSATLSNTLTVIGNTTLSNTLAVTGNTTLSNTLAVTGAATFANTVNVTGSITFSNTLAVTGAANLSSTLGVVGAATFSNTINALSTVTVNSLVVTTSITANGSIGSAGEILTSNGSVIYWGAAGSSMVYPGAGVAVSNGSAWSTSLTAPSGDIVGTSDSQTLTNKTLTDPIITGTIQEDVYTISDGAAFEIDPGNGSVQLVTLGASRTPKATNFAAGEVVMLMVDDGTARTLTWTDATWGGSGIVWKTNSGTAPTLNTTGYTVIMLWKVGTQVYGARVGNA